MQDRERVGSFSRKSSMGPSEDELISMTDNKYSRKRLTTGFTTEDIVIEKSQKNCIATLVQKYFANYSAYIFKFLSPFLLSSAWSSTT